MKNNWLKNNWLILVTGLVIGIAALVLGAHGNPGNMGFCIACFLRDTAGALGLHGAEVVQYFRPEIVGILLGSLIAAVAAKEFKGRGGSSPMIRFLLGVFVMIGCADVPRRPLRMVHVSAAATGTPCRSCGLHRGHSRGRCVPQEGLHARPQL